MAEQGQAGAAPQGTGVEQGSQGNGLHESFISSAPEHLRDAARELVPYWDPYVQKQFTEHSQFRKSMEPYEQLGISDVDPQELQELLEFREILQDEDQFRQWYESIGELMGDPQAQQEIADELGLPPELLQTINETQQAVQALLQQQQAQAQQQALQQTAQEVRQELDALKKDNPNLTDEDEDFICTLALKYDTPDALQKGFQDYQKLMGRAEQGVFNSKTSPDLRVAPVSGGNSDTSTEPVTTFEQAARAARERLRQNV